MTCSTLVGHGRPVLFIHRVRRRSSIWLLHIRCLHLAPILQQVCSLKQILPPGILMQGSNKRIGKQLGYPSVAILECESQMKYTNATANRAKMMKSSLRRIKWAICQRRFSPRFFLNNARLGFSRLRTSEFRALTHEVRGRHKRIVAQ